MAYTPPRAVREPRGYQREPHLRLMVGCAIGALVLAIFAGVVNFGLGRDPSSLSQVTGNNSTVTGVHRSPSVAGAR